MTQSTLEFFSGPEPMFTSFSDEFLRRDEHLPEVFDRFPTNMHRGLRIIARTHGIECAFLLGAIVTIREEPPAALLDYSNKVGSTGRAYNDFYKLVKYEDEKGFHARFDGAAQNTFSCRLVCTKVDDTHSAIDVDDGKYIMGIVIPEYQELIEAVCPKNCHPYFAYAQFSESTDRILIGKMHAPLWDSVSEAVREKYAAWPQVLLAAIEKSILLITEDARYTSSRGESGRFERTSERIAVELAVLRADTKGILFTPQGKVIVASGADSEEKDSPLVTEALTTAGYKVLPESVFKQRVSTIHGVTSPECVRFKYLTISGIPGNFEDTLSVWRDSIKVMPNRKALAFARMHRAEYHHSGVPLTSDSRKYSASPTFNHHYVSTSGPLHQIERAASLAPVCVEDPDLLTLGTSRLERDFQRILQSPLVTAALERIPRYFVPMSKGPRGAARQDWWSPPEQQLAGQFFHLSDQNRHPWLRFAVPDLGKAGVLCVGLKGAGFLDAHDLPLRQTSYLRAMKLHAPILSNTKKLGTIHEYWGGLIIQDAQSEFDNLLGLASLVNRVAPKLGAVAAQPIDICRFTSLPVWNSDGEPSWLSPLEYSQEVLGRRVWNATPEFVCLRTACVSDVRISQLVNRIFSPDGIESLSASVRKEMVDSTMAYLFQMHGYEFEAPAFPLPSDGGKISATSIAQYLALAADLQPTAAKRIYHTFESKLFTSMAAVHGIDGHLGGIELPKQHQLAIRGGPLSLRNVGADGLLHDVDHYCHIPVCPRRGSSFIDKQDLVNAQVLDFVALNDTMYWLGVILGQRHEVPQQAMATFSYGPKFSVQRFRDDEGTIEEEINAIQTALNQEKETKGILGPLLPQIAGSRAQEYAELKSRVKTVVRSSSV